MKCSKSSKIQLGLAAATAVSLAASLTQTCEAFTSPLANHVNKRSASSLGVSIGLGPDDQPPTPEKEAVEEKVGHVGEKTIKFDNPYDPERVILGEDGEPLAHITDHDPYRESRMSNSDRAADAWFGAMLDSEGDSFLGSISEEHKQRLLQKVELVDEPVINYGEEEWTPYVVRRLPTSPLYPAYGLETYGLPVPRRGAEAWRHFDVNGLIAMDYSGRPEGTGTDKELNEKEIEDTVASLKSKGAWLDDDACDGRLVYINGRFCPALSKTTDEVKNLNSADFESGLSAETLELLSRLPDGHTDKLAAEVPDSSKGPLTSLEKLSGPDHCVGKATSQFAINNQQGTAAFAALNSVKAGSAAYVHATVKEEGEAAPKPVLVVNAQTPSGGSASAEDDKGVAFHPRLLAVADDESVLSLVQMCVDLNEDLEEASCATFVNGYTQVYVGANANVTHSFLEESGGQATSRVEISDKEAEEESIANPREEEAKRPALRDTNFQAIDVHITGDEGAYAGSIMELGGCGRSRIAISTCLLRPGASAAINGFALSGGAQRSDIRTNIHHMAQGTISRQEQRNMVGGRSTASFRGRIRVEQSAQQTDSEQLSRTILLSDHARIWATPSLEIIADDVTCTHGATVSDLSEEELFYLRSRGLDRTTARNLLMYAFVEEIGSSVDERIAGGFEDENGLRSRVVRRLENLVPQGEKTLVGGEFQSV